jgi:hypothetical protein
MPEDEQGRDPVLQERALLRRQSGSLSGEPDAQLAGPPLYAALTSPQSEGDLECRLALGGQLAQYGIFFWLPHNAFVRMHRGENTL